ncbi:MAG: phosphatidate cytidylyltransferase [Bacteroidales bacterium]|nr:phosphatidate cytidylyltransferase [Bacteroidales bacterium]
MSNGKIKNLAIRATSGAVYAALMVLATLYPIGMIPLMCFLSVVGLVEFFRMRGEPSDNLSRNILIVWTVLVYLFFLLGQLSPMIPIGQYQIFHYFILLFFFLVIVEIFRKREDSLRYVGADLFAMFWIVLPMALLTDACLNKAYGGVVLLSFVLIWINDSFAYMGGSLYGRHKMIERISPNKTWEGTITGIVFTMLASLLAGYFWAEKILEQASFHWYGWLLFGLSVAVLATMGDLLESLLKRQAGVKDSGRIMPGHGGVLDRMDSILLTAYPVVTFLAILLML